MADFQPDLSSYPKPVAPTSLLDQVQKFGNIQQQQQAIQNNAISIDKNKLDLINTQFGLINNELSNLAATPGVSKQQAAERLNRFATTYKLPPEAVNHMMTELQQSPDVKSFAEFALRRGMDVQQKINQTYGQNSSIDTGQVIQPGIVRSPMQGGGFQPSGLPVQKQLPVGTPGYDENNQPSYAPPGTNTAAPGTQTFPPLPVARPASASGTGPTGPTREITDQVPTDFNNRFAASQPSSFKPAPSQLTDEGKKAYAQDQLLASQKMTAVKPALEALKLLPGLRSGPSTEPYNKAVAFLKANNIIDTQAENDPTVIYQEANKYLSQYLKGRGGRSDADLVAAEKSSPNVAYQLNPALINLTKNAIAQDRIEAARANAFKGNDYSKYLQHQGSFPQSIDDRAFKLDLGSKEESQTLVRKMYDQYKNGNADEKKEATKFLNSLDIAHKQGFY